MVPVVSRKIKFSPGRQKSPWIIPVVSKKYINGPSAVFLTILPFLISFIFFFNLISFKPLKRKEKRN